MIRKSIGLCVCIPYRLISPNSGSNPFVAPYLSMTFTVSMFPIASSTQIIILTESLSISCAFAIPLVIPKIMQSVMMLQ